MTPNLHGSPPERISHARCFQGNSHKLYINQKVMKCIIFDNIIFYSAKTKHQSLKLVSIFFISIGHLYRSVKFHKMKKFA